MSLELGFNLHPGAAEDFLDIWEFIAAESPLAAQRLREEIGWFRFPAAAINGLT